jgi:hypothetical protein
MPIKKLEDDPLTTAKTLELTAIAFQLPTAQQAAEAAFGACAAAAAFAGWTLEQFIEWVKGSAEVSFKNSVLPSPMPPYEKAQKFMAEWLDGRRS